jgi:CBS domain-containing protein
MRVGHFMTRQVVTVAPDTPILEAAQLMLRHKIGGLPVVDASGRVVGLLSERDLLGRRKDDDRIERPHWLQLMLERAELADLSARFRDRKVSDVMTRDPVTVSAASPIAEACRLIEEHGIKRLPVVEDGKLVGIIARADLVRALARAAEKTTTVKKPEISVDARLAELERQNWQHRARRAKPF